MMRPRKPITILMADDDADDRQMTREAFEQARVANDLRFVENGAELMDYLHHRDKFEDLALSPLPGLILLDLNMPLKDGREALREIKADPRLKSIRTIVMTTSSAEEDVYRSYQLGAESFITKPVTFAAFVDAVQAMGRYWLEIVELPRGYEGEKHA
jgi:two-component system response regulator